MQGDKSRKDILSMKRFMGKRNLIALLVIGVVAASLIKVYAAIVPTLLAQGTIGFFEPFNGPAQTYVIKATAEPGDTTGWHYHPGPATVIITRGIFTEEEGCGDVIQFSAGQAFTEVGGPGSVHKLTNTGTEQGEFYFLVTVPPGSPRTIPVAGPRCGPPTKTDECKAGGWTRFNYPQIFQNEGECVSFVAAGN
jgi:quercetin dioxygenase-like cupin family protein